MSMRAIVNSMWVGTAGVDGFHSAGVVGYAADFA